MGCLGARRRLVISPAIASCRARGIDVSGPFPGDTVFLRAHRGEFDVVVACYHDQGLIPVKLVAFGEAVNVTLGLPIVRTSVDHGTAFDIAGRGIANPESMIAAVLLAARLASATRAAPSPMAEQTEREKAQSNIAENRKAFHDFHLLETFEAGMVLLGTEVKAIREGRVNLRDSFARVEDGEVYLYNVNISSYSHRGLCRSRAAPPPQAAAAPQRDPEADREDGRKGHDARAGADVLQEGPRQGRRQSGQGQKGLRQARDDQAPRGRSRDARRGEGAASVTWSPLPRAKADRWLFIAYGVLTLYFTAPLLVTGNQLGVEDWDVLLLYHASVIRNVLEYGTLPFWNPWYCGGNVLWQNPQVALLSPVYPLSLVVSLPLAMKLNIVLHYLVGFAGMHVLLTRGLELSFLPAVFFLNCLFTIAGGPVFHLAAGHATFLPYFFLPWLLFFFLRGTETGEWRQVVAAAAVIALSIYNGGIHIAFMASTALAIFALSASALRRDWRPMAMLAMTGALAFLFAAPKLLPVAHVRERSAHG